MSATAGAVSRAMRCLSPRISFARRRQQQTAIRGFASLALGSTEEEGNDGAISPSSSHKHCGTCTCEEAKVVNPCGSPSNFKHQPLPPPLPEPQFTFHKRVLPSSLTALSSKEGRKYLKDAIEEKSDSSYWALTEHFVNQSDPAFCGVTTLMVVLNAMCVDPQVRWRGGWRFFGSEEVLLDRCCFSRERIQRAGITMEEFQLMGRCHGLGVSLKRPNDDNNDMDAFRRDIQTVLCQEDSSSVLVVSFARSALGQTGEGHFSPLAAYHVKTDQVLLLDVARFKYSPYWVSISDLYGSLKPLDEHTQSPRGWFVLEPPSISSSYAGPNQVSEGKRPASIVPAVGQEGPCPVGKIKIEYCAGHDNNKTN